MPLPCPVPAELRHIAEAVGEDATLALVEHFGGTSIWLPKQAGATCRLAKAIGPDAAAALIDHFGYGKFQVPLARFWLIRLYSLQGESAVRIARRLRVTEKCVRDVRRAHRRHNDRPVAPPPRAAARGVAP